MPDIPHQNVKEFLEIRACYTLKFENEGYGPEICKRIVGIMDKQLQIVDKG